jgi:hypothetical protein
MTVLMWLALVLQSCSVAMLRLGLGKAWLRRPGTLLVLASVVYDGLSQVLVAFPSIAQWDMYRNGIQPGFIAEADLIMSAGMLAFTVAYLMTWRPRRQAPAAAGDAGLVARVLDWRLLALACLPLAVLTYEGRGYNGAAMPGASSPSIADTFFVILVILTAFAFLLRHGERWFVPVLAAQSLLLAAAGERGMVITGAIALTVLLCWCGLRPRRSHLHAAVALTLLAVLAITGLRAEQGRSVFWSDSGLGTRAKALGDGLSAAAGRGTPGLAAPAAVRLDGTAFAAAVLQAESSGQPGLSAWYVPQSLLQAVPSAVWPSKLADGALHPVHAELDRFGLQQVNFLPGLTGLYTGFLPWPGLIAFTAVVGIAWGLGERWLLRRLTAPRLVLLAGALSAALGFEGGVPGMLITLRAAAAIAVIAWASAGVIVRHRVPVLSYFDLKRARREVGGPGQLPG